MFVGVSGTIKSNSEELLVKVGIIAKKIFASLSFSIPSGRKRNISGIIAIMNERATLMMIVKMIVSGTDFVDNATKVVKLDKNANANNPEIKKVKNDNASKPVVGRRIIPQIALNPA